MRIGAGINAFITGGISGIGLSIAELLLEKGASVYLCDINQSVAHTIIPRLQSKYSINRVQFSLCNVMNSEELSSVFRRAIDYYHRIHIIINNAGFGDRDQLLDTNILSSSTFPKDWSNVINICLNAVIDGTRLGVSHMIDIGKKEKEEKGNNNNNNNNNDNNTNTKDEKEEIGVILNIASVGGLHPMPISPIYCAAKHGVIGFSRSLRYLSSSHGIRVNALCPSFTDTDLVKKGMGTNKNFKKYIDTIKKMTGELLTPQQIAVAALLIIEGKQAGGIISVSNELGIAQHFPIPMQPSTVTKVLVPIEKLKANL